MKRYDRDYYPGEDTYYGNQKLSQRSFWQRYRWFILASGVLGVLVILFASTTLYLLVNRSAPTTSSSSQLSRLPASQGTLPAQAAITTPAATSIPPTPTTASRTISKNISIPCVSSTAGTCGEAGITVQLVSVVIDPTYGSQGRLIYNFMLTNKGPQSAEVAGGPDRFAKDLIVLQDPTGTSIRPDGGTLLSSSEFANGASLPLTITFPLAPQSGAAYLLHISLGVSKDFANGRVYSEVAYQTFNLTA